jgi:membrane protein DedA with SNARE-associated domain
MFWAINAGAGSVFSYVLNIVFFAVVSMAAGHLTYWFGRFLARKYGKRIRKQKKIAEHLPTVRKFGGIIILISALTPLPWATISMIMGVIAYKYRYYTLFAFARIIRFVLNGFLIYHTGSYFF